MERAAWPDGWRCERGWVLEKMSAAASNQALMINEVSRQVNLSQKRIREYEKEGFIKPDREERTNNRLFTSFDILQIRRVNHLIHSRGFTVSCLRHLLVLAPCWNIFECPEKEQCAAYHNPHRPCWQVRMDEETVCPGPCPRCAIFLNRNQSPGPILEKEENR